MTDDVYEINSQGYWESRFKKDWDSMGGPQQSRFFAELGLRLLPAWVRLDIDRCRSLADVGCAEGEGAAFLKERFPALDVTGIDFSQQAVDVARQRHPEVEFVQGDVGALDQRFDIVFCSNVLEHFHEPLQKLESLVKAAKRYVVVLVPGWEYERHYEHHVTFTLSSFPRSVGHMQCVFAGAVNSGEVNQQWAGYQIAVVYAVADVLAAANGTLADVLADFQLRDLSVRDLEKLYPHDPSIGRLGELAALRRQPLQEDSATAAGLRALEQRQEQIGFHTRHEVLERISMLEERILSAARAHQERDELAAVLSKSEDEQRRLKSQLEDAELALVASLNKSEEEQRRLGSQLEDAVSANLQTLRERDAMQAQIGSWQKYAAALNEDRQRLEADLRSMHRLFSDTRASTSWRLTGPFRWLSERMMGKAAAPEIPDVRGLHEVEFPHVQLDGVVNVPIGQKPEHFLVGDLTWSEFNERVLKKRAEYRGVFVQEMVIDWNVPLYQRPQHLATAIARLGYLVIYVTPQWGGDIVDGFRQISPGIWLTSSWEVNTIHGAVRSVYSTAYAHSPEQLCERPADSVMLYEYIDHIDPQISGEGEVIESLLKLKSWAFEGGADLVVASARVLYAEAESAVGAGKVVMVPNGVDTRHYRDPSQGKIKVDPRLVEFCGGGKPIIGYFGAIAPWLWYEEIQKLVASRPDLGFVFIGPDYHGGVERLPSVDNVLYLGPVDYKVLPAHARLFDVCLIPFRPGEIARTTSPLKLFEYFALEKPVVVTSEMVECVAYPEVFRGTTADELSDALDAALVARHSASSRNRLKALADENDWDRRAEALVLAVERLRDSEERH